MGHLSWLAGLVLVYLATRMYRLLSIPVFVDEAIHIDFARLAAQGDWRSGGGYGKWLAIQSYGLVLGTLEDSLFGARLVPVFLGLLTVCLLFFAARSARGEDGLVPAFVGALTYTVVPFALFYDRVALTDAFLTVLLGLIFFFSLRCLEQPTRWNRVLLGVLLLLSPMFKFSGLFLAAVPIVIAAIISRRGERFRNLVSLGLSYGVAIPIVVLFCLTAAPEGEAGKLIDPQSVKAWLGTVLQNLVDGVALFWSMLTPILFLWLVIGCAALIAFTRRRDSRVRVLAAVAVMVLLALPYVVFFGIWYPRYFLPLLVPLCLVAGEVALYLLREVGPRYGSVGKSLSYVMVSLVLVVAATQSIRLCVDPQGFPYYRAIRSQFFTGWTSGFGLREAIEEINRLSQQSDGRIRILRSYRSDIPRQGLDVYARELGSQTKRMTTWEWASEKITPYLSEVLSDPEPTYLLFNGAYPYRGDREVIETIREHFEVSEVARFVKPDQNPGLCIWRLDLHSPETEADLDSREHLPTPH